MKKIKTEEWRADLPAFAEKTKAFYAGELGKNDYKGFSGYYGSYAQRGGTANMLRLRMTAGRVTKEKLAFIVKMMREYHVDMLHFTTCQTIQLHNLDEKAVCEIMEKALDAGIVTIGGGGDFPRNVMCSPLSGVEQGEYFDVLPYAEAAAEYALQFVKEPKMPRKLKIGFSGSPANLTHATYRDLGFAAREDGKFDVYSAGGLGNNPRFGVKVAEAVEPQDILYYVRTMHEVFCAYGNYKNRGKARTRYMQEALGGADAYRTAFLEKLEEVRRSGEDFTFTVNPQTVHKEGDGSTVSGKRVIAQKQEDLYTVTWHPLGGQPCPDTFCRLGDLLETIPGAEMRLAPDETAYIVNLTGTEAEKVLEATADGAKTLFETSVSCIGASICQVGVRDSQELLREAVKAVREAEIPDGALPQIHISGCPSSCGTHQTGALGFRGGAKSVDGKSQPAFVLYVNGCEYQGEERMGYEAGTLLQSDIPAFLTELGRTVAASGLDFYSWYGENPKALDVIVEKYAR